MKKIGLFVFFLPLCGLWFIGQGSYIHAKALLAQVLLDAAWADTLQGRKEVKPWPWADTWPVSRISVPRLGIDRIVLAGANGPSLAFGPGLLFESANPGTYGNTVIAGHRDTHFNFLKDVQVGDMIELETATGEVLIYRVRFTLVVNETDAAFMEIDAGHYLTLITCFPFDAIQPGGPLRYVVQGKYMARKESIPI